MINPIFTATDLRVSEVRLIEHPHSGVPCFWGKTIAPDASGIDAPEEYFREAERSLGLG